MAFGDKLKELRAKHNITQQELGDIMGVSRATIAGYETKNKEPDFDKLRFISNYFKVSLDYLLETDIYDKSEEDKTVATHRVDYGEDLPEDAQKDIKDFINYLRFKHSK